MPEMTFKHGDRVKLSDGSEHTFLIDRRTLEHPIEGSKKYPYLTVDSRGIPHAFDVEGVHHALTLRLLPPENWEYVTLVNKPLGVEAYSCLDKEQALGVKDDMGGIALRVDFGRGLTEQLEGDDV